jgi:preprotein translocase subunit SecE
VARQTRAQRRARRAEQQRQSSDGAVAQRSAATPTRSLRAPEPARVDRQPRGGGFARFLGESWGELKKVEWPTQNQLIQGTVVVIIACVIVGLFLWGSDLVLKPLVRRVFL